MPKSRLKVNPEFASPQINYKSRDSHFIFGDVCTATVVEAQEGRKVFKELLPIVSNVILSHLDEMQVSQDELKRLWLHQANINMNIYAAKKILNKADVPDHQAPLVLDEYANTASAGSIIAFHKYKSDFVSGEKGILCSFGAGYSVGCIGLEKL
jgi:beta-ketodecanoyl-[acyl-carrier-protein] synthase